MIEDSAFFQFEVRFWPLVSISVQSFVMGQVQGRARLALRRTFSPAAAMLRVGYFRRGLRVTARARRRLPSPSQLSGGTGATRVLRLGLRTLLAHATDVGLSPCWTTHVGVGQGGEGGSRRDDGSTNR